MKSIAIKSIAYIAVYMAMTSFTCLANEPSNKKESGDEAIKENLQQALQQHGEKAQSLAIEQDELSADVQDLIDEQTDAEVIGILREIEVIMADATDLLEQKNTGGATIATETEVIEKIFEAAKKKQQNQKKDGG